jgi:DHA1 family inner membrane transport protein
MRNQGNNDMPVWIYVLALGAFGLITTELGIIGILPQLSLAFGVSIQTCAWLLSGFALTVAVAGPGMTLLFSRLNRKLSLCCVLALFVFSNFASAMAPSFGWLLVLRVMPAFIHPVFWSIAMSAAAAAVPPAKASRAVSIVFAGMSAGIVFGIPLASYCASLGNWRTAFVVFGVLNLIALAAHFFLLPALPAISPIKFGVQIRILRKGVLWWNLALQVLLTAAVFSIYGYMAEYLAKVAGMNANMISMMLLLFGIAGVGGTLAAGRLMSSNLDRVVSIFLASFAPVLVLLFLPAPYLFATIVLVVAWGVVHAAAVPLCQALVVRAAPETPEFSNSLFNSFGNIGITCGTLVGGRAIAMGGIEMLPMASLALLVVAGFIFAVERRRYKTVAA